jgi:hypothetical protein
MTELGEEARWQPEPHGEANRPPHDAAQHVATRQVRRQHTVRNQVGGGAAVISQDAHADIIIAVGSAIGLAAGAGDGFQQRNEQIGVVVRALTHRDGGDAL